MKKTGRPLSDYPVLTAGALSLAGACVALYYDQKHIAIKGAVALTALMLFSMMLHTLTKSDPKWRSVGLRHRPGRVVLNLLMIGIMPASAMSVLTLWAFYLGMATIPITIIWMTSALLINIYSTTEVIKHLEWV